MDKLLEFFNNQELLGNPLFWLGAILAQVIILFLYYPLIEKRINFIGSRFFGGNQLAIYYVFFVGTVVHELSHLLACIFFWVRVRKVNFFGPQQDKDGNYTLGYVEHAVTDPFRGTFIGMAPILGSALFTYLVFVWASPELSITSVPNFESILNSFLLMLQSPLRWQNFILLYVILACATAGNPSKADLQSLPIAIISIVAIGVIFFLLGTSINWDTIETVANWFSFFTPGLMIVSTIMFFEIAILFIIQIITGFMIKSWGYKV